MKNILVVEDESILRESLRDWLTDLGYHVEVASQGDEALRLIEEMDFDVALFDLRLPGKDGLQILQEARVRKPHLKAIIITAYPTVEKAVEAMKLGAIDFLTKPIDLAHLKKLVRNKTEPVRLGTKSILVVDDEPAMRESLRDWLIELGYRVETCSSGDEALTLISERNHDVLILDLKLPGKNGLEVLKEAKKLQPDVKGIIISAYPSVDTAIEAMRQGAIEYLPKPLDLSKLEKLVAKMVEPN
jgi:DNA-binding NtrC family response regulator